MLETEWGKEALKDFIKVQLWADNDERGEEYVDLTENLFNSVGQPQYFIINKDGRVAAWFSGVKAVMSGSESDYKKNFQNFVDTAKTKGFAFDWEKGFLPPDQQPE